MKSKPLSTCSRAVTQFFEKLDECDLFGAIMIFAELLQEVVAQAWALDFLIGVYAIALSCAKPYALTCKLEHAPRAVAAGRGQWLPACTRRVAIDSLARFVREYYRTRYDAMLRGHIAACGE